MDINYLCKNLKKVKRMVKFKKAKPGAMPRQEIVNRRSTVDPLASFCLPVLIYDKTRDGSQHMVDTENVSCEEVCQRIIADMNINPTMMHCFSLAVMDDNADGMPTWLSWRDKVDRKLESSIVHFRMRFVPNVERPNEICKELLTFDKDCLQYLCWQVNWDLLHDQLEKSMCGLTDAQVYGIAVVGLLISLRLETELKNDQVEDVDRFLNRISLNDHLPKAVRKGYLQTKFSLKSGVKDKLNQYIEDYPLTQVDSTQLMMNHVKRLLEAGHIYYNREWYRACQIMGGVGPVARYPVKVTVVVDMRADCPSLAIHPDQEGPGGQPWRCNFKDLMNLDVSMEDVVGSTFWSVYIVKSGDPEVVLGYGRRQQQTLYFEQESRCRSFVSCLETFHRLAFDFYGSLYADILPVCVEKMRPLRCHGPATDDFIISKLRHRYKTNNDVGYVLRMSLKHHHMYETLYLPKHGKAVICPVGKVLETEEGYVMENSEDPPMGLKELLLRVICSKKLVPPNIVRINPQLEGCNKLQMFLLRKDEKTMFERAEEHEERRRQEAQPKVFSTLDVSHNSLLAQGHFTETHTVTLRRETDTDFVSKSIHTSVIGNSQYRDLEEALLAGMNHLMLLRETKHFVSFVGMSMTPVPGMLMKWAPYGGLKQFLQKQDATREVRLTLQHLVHVIVHVGAALKYMEENSLYHGNLHADNILVFRFERDEMGVKIGDPGLVTLYNKLSLESKVNRERMPWLAPELYPDLTRMNIKTDVFAFGTTMWQMFSEGHSPLIADPKLQGKSVQQFFESGQILSCPHYLKECLDDNHQIKTLKSNIYELMACCWTVDMETRLDPSRLLSRISLDIQSYGNTYHNYNIIPSMHEFDGSTADSYPLVRRMEESTNGASTDQDVTTSGVNMSSSLLTTPPVHDLDELRDTAAPNRQQQQQQVEVPQEAIDRRVLPSTCPLPRNEQQDRNEDDAHQNTPPASQPLPSKPSITRAVPLSVPSIPVKDVRHLIQDSRLEIDETTVLGQGHYGAVYKGTLKSHSNAEAKNIVVAVKVLKPEHAEKYSDDFRREAKLMETLDNGNIVKFYGVARNGERLIMEYMNNGSLQKYVQSSKRRKRTLPRSEKLKFAIDIAKGMDYLQQCGVVHCDLAARNVLLSDCLQAKISDFGLSKILAQDKDYYRRESAKQKTIPLFWCAPEWMKQQSCSSKSDVWSFAVVLWEINSYGDVPNLLPKEPLQEIFLGLYNGKRLNKPRECENEVYELMLLCWNWEPEPRPTFKQCQKRLEKMLETDDVNSSPSTSTETVDNLTPSSTTSPVSSPSFVSQAVCTNTANTTTSTVTAASETSTLATVSQKDETDTDPEPIRLDPAIVRNVDGHNVSSPAPMLVDVTVQVPITAGQALSSPASMLNDGKQDDGRIPLLSIPVPQATDLLGSGIYRTEKSGTDLINVADVTVTGSMGSVGMEIGDSSDFSESGGAETTQMGTSQIPVTDPETKQAPAVVDMETKQAPAAASTTTNISGTNTVLQQTHSGNMKTVSAALGENIPVPVSFDSMGMPDRTPVPGSCPITPQSSSTLHSPRMNQVEPNSPPTGDKKMFSSHPFNGLNGLHTKNYQLEKVIIGRGAYGEVRKANYGGRTVAAKRSTNKECYNRFKRELDILRELDHPNIVQFVGSDREETGERFLYFMEYMEKGDLRNYLTTCKKAGSPATCQFKLKFLIDIAQGLQYLYDECILHLDLTAQNILLTTDLTAKICDFGWAKRLEGSEDGSNNYHRDGGELQHVWASIESYTKQIFTRFSDIWSYGVVCIEVFLDGQQPRLKDQPLRLNPIDKASYVANHIVIGDRFPCPPSCPLDVYQEVVFKCWEPEPANRIRFPEILDKLRKAHERGTK